MDGLDVKRSEIAGRFIRGGNGIEIGAFGRPVQLPAGANVLYLDKYSALDTAKQHGLNHAVTPEPDIRDDGTALHKILDGSLDFLIACHFLEHCEDFIGTVEAHCRKIKPLGILFYILPDKSRMFDCRRVETTTWDHLEKDHIDHSISRERHISEWCRHVFPDANREAIRQCPESIHFHAWSSQEQTELWANICRLVPLQIHFTESLTEWPEVISVLRKLQ
jgi:hypothetical protein